MVSSKLKSAPHICGSIQRYGGLRTSADPADLVQLTAFSDTGYNEITLSIC